MRYIGCQVVLLIAAVAWAAPAGAERPPFDYFQNSWSVIGLKDYNFGTRITPDNELLLAGKRKVRFRIGPDLKPLSRAQVKVCANGWYPMILLSTTEGGVAYQFEFWATPLPSVPDWKAAFDGPVAGLRHDGAATAAQAGEDFLNWVVVGMTTLGRGVYPAKVRMEIIDGDKVDGQTREWALETVRAEILCDVYRIPFEASYDEARFSDEDWQVWRNRTREYWEQRVRGTTRIIVPDEKATDALLAAHVTQLIANDHGEVHGGEGFYDEFYIRDGAYQVMELEEAGMMDVARVAVGKYLEHQLPDGRFESQKGQFDANGQAVWVLWQFYKITGDAAWLAEVYPKMRRAVDWTMKARRQAPADSPFAGVLPNAVADGEYLWDGKHHIVGYDFWNLRGMLCTADAAKALDRRDEAGELMKEADAYRAAIDAAWKRTDVPYFPPSWEKAGTHWGNTETLWPTPLFALDDPRVTALDREVREHHGGGFCEGTIRWTGMPDVIHPYMSAYTTMASLVRGDSEQVVEDFYWYLLHSTATHAFPEGIYFKKKEAWNHTIPHVTGACNYAILLRHMLVHEQGDELHLLTAVPDWWLEWGSMTAVENIPTHFGKLSLHVTGQSGGVWVGFDPPTERPPRRVVLHLPSSRKLAEPVPGVEVVRRPPQKKRWDFETVVRMYESR